METKQVRIPDGYFLKMAKADYTDWHRALPREFYQNSVDAGASQIVVTTDEDNRTITVQDNGCGMGYDTLVDKLFVLGGTKKAEGSGKLGPSEWREASCSRRFEMILRASSAVRFSCSATGPAFSMRSM